MSVGIRAREQEEYLPFEMGYVPEFYQRKAVIELHDTPENRERGLKLIREMAKKDKHLSSLVFDDDFLLQYLKCKKYNLERAFKQLKNFANLRRKHPDMFTNIYFESLYLGTRDKVLNFMPKRCQDGCVIYFVKLNNWIPDEFPVEELKRIFVVQFFQSMRDPMTQVNGYKVIFDAKSNPLRHLHYCVPTNLYLLYHGTQECVAGRFKEVHIVNISFTFKIMWKILKHVISEKLRNRIYFHDRPDDLLKYFPREVLPAEYGGDVEDYDTTAWLKKATEPKRLATLGGRGPNRF